MLSNKIQYIGCDDATLDLFESQYPLPNGMCYNSYLLLGERVAVPRWILPAFHCWPGTSWQCIIT